MTRKTIVELTAEANSSFADNVTGAITPALLRQFCLDFLDTIRPSYGACSLTGPLGKAVTTTYSTFTWQTQIAAQAPDYTVSLASGTIVRSGGPASARVSFSIDVIAPNNTIVTFALFVNGAITPWVASVTSTSATDTISLAFAGINYNASATIDYQIQVKSTASGNITLSNGVFVVENVPVNTN